MTCYRQGGCGPYESRPCNECPASKPEYAARKNPVIVHCHECQHHDRCMMEKIFLSEGIADPFCCRGKWPTNMKEEP